MSICSRVSSYLESYKPTIVKGSVISVMTGMGYLLAGGVPGALLTLGSYWTVQKLGLFQNRSVQQKVTPSVLRHASNSCFNASTFQALFLNEPTLLREIPHAIERRLGTIFLADIDTILAGDLNPPAREALLEIGVILGGSRPVPKGHWNELCQHLRTLEFVGWPGEMNSDASNSLLSLLELTLFIEKCQHERVIDQNDMHAVRAMLNRVNSHFSRDGSEMNDAYEALISLANLIFEGSPLNQNEYLTRVVKSPLGLRLAPGPGINPATGEMTRTMSDKNWGHFEVGVRPGVSVQKHLDDSFVVDHPCKDWASYPAQGCSDLMPFEIVKEKHQLGTAPPLLVVNFKRFSNSGDPDMAPIQADSKITLSADYFKDRNEGRYELQGVVQHLHPFAHYIAHVKKPDGSHYLCNDLLPNIEPIAGKEFLAAANQGYILVYRKV